MTSSVVGPRRSSKSLTKAKHAPKKGPSHYLVVCCWSDPLQLSESQQNHYIWEVCLANWWDALKTTMPAPDIGQKNGPNSSPWQCPTACRTTNTSKVEWVGLPHQPYLPDLLSTYCYFFKHCDNFLQGCQASWQPAAGRKCFPRIHRISKHRFLHYRNKQFSLAKMCWW